MEKQFHYFHLICIYMQMSSTIMVLLHVIFSSCTLNKMRMGDMVWRCRYFNLCFHCLSINVLLFLYLKAIFSSNGCSNLLLNLLHLSFFSRMYYLLFIVLIWLGSERLFFLNFFFWWGGGRLKWG